MAQEKRILVPVDGSAPSVRALEFAHGLCGALGARLDVVTVLDLLRIDPFEGYGMTDAQFSELQVKIRDDILKHMRAQLGDSATQIETRLLQGKILEVLLEESDQDDVMMVVVGRTGKGFFERMIEGSVSRGLAKHASKPVLVIP